MAQPVDWLGIFIEEEILRVIAWKEEQLNAPYVKQDPDSRYEDDHSNFRSVANSTLLPREAKVQISSIQSTDGQVVAFITDGFTRVRARLSDAVVRALEDELGERISLETKGDVFIIQHVTVESTPYGPSDGFVQLAIGGIEYLFHLRKSLGKPRPVQERETVISLLQQISQLRQRQQAVEESLEQSEPDSSSFRQATSTPRHTKSSNGNATPQSQRSARLSQPASQVIEQSPTTQRTLATQIPSRRKPNTPSLAHDGFEVEDGINLDRPVPPRQGGSNGSINKPSREQVAAASGTAALLSLLGKRKAEDQVSRPVSTKPRPLSPNISRREAPPNESRPSVKSEPAVFAPFADDSEETSVLVPVKAPSVERQHTVQSSQQRDTSAEGRKRYYTRRKIPGDQQKLLDKPASWLPSLPSHTFPRPNVPIDLLRRWNSRISEVSKGALQIPLHASRQTSAQKQSDNNRVEVDQPESSSAENTSDDEQLGPSQWPPTPVPKTHQLPPDSTMASNVHSSTSKASVVRPDELGNSNGKSSIPTHRSVAVRSYSASNGLSGEMATQQTPSRLLPSSSPMSSRTLASSHKRSGELPLNRGKHSYPGGSTAQLPSTKHSGDARPSTSESVRPTTVSPSITEASFMRPSPRPIKRPSHSPIVTSPIVVKGTQLSPSGGDDMEMSVPRSLDRDPYVAHRQRRSEHFRGAQRQEWIKANYTTSASTQSQWMALYRAYKEAHPKDSIKPSEFAEALAEVEASSLDSPKNSRRSEPSMAPAASVASTSYAAETTSADLGGAVATALPAPRREAEVMRNSGSPAVSTSKEKRSSDGNLFQQFASQIPEAGMKASKDGEAFSSSQNPSSRHFEKTTRAQPVVMTSSLGNLGIATKAIGHEAAAGLENSLPVFSEFARAWKSIAPGGAFAAKSQPKTGKAAAKLNVLRWGL